MFSMNTCSLRGLVCVGGIDASSIDSISMETEMLWL